MFVAIRGAVLGLIFLVASPVAAAGGYNEAGAAAYADQYWSSYNQAWPSFANSGGDCTNFVSQALYAGGIAMRSSPEYSGNAAWYMLQQTRKRWSWSASWVNAQADFAFISQLPGVTPVASASGLAPGQVVPSNAAQGDVVFYDWNNDGTFDHEAIIATADGQYVDAHTNNRYHAYWTLAQYNSSWQTTRIVVLHVPAGTS